MTTATASPSPSSADADSGPPIALSVRDLRVTFSTVTGPVEAVRGVSFELLAGRTLGLVGESGSGKSVSSYSVLRLLPETAHLRGSIVLHGRDPGDPGDPGVADVDVLTLPPRDPRLFAVRGGRAGMVFQEPMTALSPVHRTGEQVAETLRIHHGASRAEAWKKAVDMLDRVGIPEPDKRAKQYPFEFSGGMRQRVVIAMALACRPRVLIADEPTTALDVTVQAQILRLIQELKDEVGTSVLFITHDLGVIAQVADDVAVMRDGRVVEIAPVDDLFHRPLHPYSRKLLSSVPGVPKFTTEAETWRQRLPDSHEVFQSECGREPELLSIGGGRQLLGIAAVAGQPQRPADDAGLGQAELPPSPAVGQMLLQVRGLTKQFPVKADRRRSWSESLQQAKEHGVVSIIRPPRKYFKAVDDVDLEVYRGETIGLVGESGSGKTTLVRCILRVLEPTAGEALFYGDPTHDGPSTSAACRTPASSRCGPGCRWSSRTRWRRSTRG